jgi:hypothetical protein
MNCELAHERIVVASYGELPDELIHDLDRHMAECADCRTERDQLLALKLLADAYPVLEPEANLIARSRLRLEEALDALPPMRWYERLIQRMSSSFASLAAVPVAASLLLVAGLGAGTWGGYEMALRRATHAATALQTASAAPVQAPVQQVASTKSSASASVSEGEAAEVANISSIVRQPQGDLVEVRYNQLVPKRIKGSMSDPAIQQLLMLASQNATSAGVRSDSVGLLATECRNGNSCREEGIRDALLISLRYDKNASVREKALKGLEPYIAQDVLVRDAVLEAVMNDSDSRIRNAAINLLEPVEADTSVRQVLHNVADSDQNPYIRTVSRQVLNRVPEIQ